ncbi:hydantoinase/oxoprolinase family protein [Deinococcus humi]|uniref:N-methylhydantoinase A/oxoprolinase/acetone carboxylase beta subunit n=1 Tax=Deinococcus humi TaxID=662880 RepID=A0A7W8NFF9_9DEIO|nr:hydantoinase/oxoprolinase family protein [Deinococcus humi]MBB5364396.1 N-methylhydantoinase A/oxoprolinase/acetone carboxylase beta subunit [Deinococcus humi]GGO33271.1 ATP-utilizing protein [Deinococcus humi]
MAVSETGVRIGIDVGGTFTKGVALGLDGQLQAVSHAPTTHDHAQGVAAGVLEALDRLLTKLPASTPVLLVAHSTTQATNALLEGDTARIGVLALGEKRDKGRIRKVTQPPAGLRAEWAFVASDQPDFRQRAQAVLEGWQATGVQAVAVSEAFGVDDGAAEREAGVVARSLGLPVTLGSDLSGSYGLEMRTVSAAINASILPTMLRTAGHVREAVNQRLPGVPLLIMRGDGGAASLEAFEETPIHTVVSGPAASLGGGILREGLMDGIFFEVGGTSTNVGAVKDGRPVLKYMTVLGAPTGLRAVDIRIAGVAGGSLVRLSRKRIEEVGPRSAHIAGFPYASFASLQQLEGARLVELPLTEGGPGGYALLATPSGERFAITPTCAANALGAIGEDGRAFGEAGSARLALTLLGERLGASMEAAATAVLEACAEKLTALVRELAREHGLQGMPLYGGGGAASVLGPVIARRLGVPFQAVAQADVISSIGAALAVIRVERERSVTRQDPTILDLLEREVGDEAVRLGADPGSLRVETAYLPQEGRLRAVAVGAHALSARTRVLDHDELHAQARLVLDDTARLTFGGQYHSLFTATHELRSLFRRRRRHPALVLDPCGVRLLRFEDATVFVGTPAEVLAQFSAVAAGPTAPHVAVLTPTRLRDYAHLHDRAALNQQLHDSLRLEPQVALIVRRE